MSNIPIGLQISTYGLMITTLSLPVIILFILAFDYPYVLDFLLISGWTFSVILQYKNLKKEQSLFYGELSDS